MLALLILSPLVSPAWSQGEAAGEENKPEISRDPLGRLPASPEEAHQRLEERGIKWPAGLGGDGSSFDAASVKPGVRVAIPYDTVEGFTNHPGRNVKVELLRGGPVIQTVTVTAQADGWFKADLSTGNIQSGDVVRVTDLADATLVSVNCVVTGSVDFANDKVNGTAVAGNTVDVYIIAPSTYYQDMPPGAAHWRGTAAGGLYNAAFAGLFNIRRGDAAFVFSTDGSGNSVSDVATGSGGGLVAYPQYDDVMGFYQPGTAMTVQAGTASRNVTALGDGFFEAWFTNYNIVAGDTVSCNMGGARSIIVRDVSATCDPATNHVKGTAPANRDLRITMDVNGNPVVVETTSDASGAFDLSLAGLYTITGSEVYSVTWYDDDGDACIYEFQTFSWYLAEGYTGGDFDTWVLVQNPGTETANVTMTFQLLQGTAPPYSFDLPGGMRRSVHLDELPGLADAQVSTMVTSTGGHWIVSERAEYFTYEGKKGGHDSIGTITPSGEWYLAEGYTGGQFDTWVLVQNPGTEAATVTMTFQLLSGSAQPYSFVLPAGTRQSIHLDTLPGLADAQVSTKVTSDKPVVAERAEYFIYDGKQGGSDSIGTTTPTDTWYLAEGYTGGQFDTWVLVQNPGTETATVTMSFQLVTGTAPNFTFTLEGGKRQSIHLDTLPGLTDAQVSTKVKAADAYGNPLPVVAERAEYFIYNGKPGGHDSIGVPELF